jgi:tripartite-type tricarboxylate transporter receptor subunit TctC
MSPERSRFLPEVPTILEAGVKGTIVVLREGLLAPRGVPPEILSRLEKELMQVMAMPEVQKGIEATFTEPIRVNAEQSSAFLKAEYAKWTKLVGSLGLQAD